MKIVSKSFVAVGAGALLLAGMTFVPLAGAASTTTVTANIAKVASIATTSGTVTLNITPTSGGSYTSLSDTVNAATNSSAGYTLQLSASPVALTNGANTLAAVSGTPASPSTIGVNQWGYRVDGQQGFGAGTTTADTNAASSSQTKWAGPTATATTIKSTAVASASDSTTVWYEASADLTKPSGNYTSTVTYTAVAN